MSLDISEKVKLHVNAFMYVMGTKQASKVRVVVGICVAFDVVILMCIPYASYRSLIIFCMGYLTMAVRYSILMNPGKD